MSYKKIADILLCKVKNIFKSDYSSVIYKSFKDTKDPEILEILSFIKNIG